MMTYTQRTPFVCMAVLCAQIERHQCYKHAEQQTREMAKNHHIGQREKKKGENRGDKRERERENMHECK